MMAAGNMLQIGQAFEAVSHLLTAKQLRSGGAKYMRWLENCQAQRVMILVVKSKRQPAIKDNNFVNPHQSF